MKTPIRFHYHAATMLVGDISEAERQRIFDELSWFVQARQSQRSLNISSALRQKLQQEVYELEDRLERARMWACWLVPVAGVAIAGWVACWWVNR